MAVWTRICMILIFSSFAFLMSFWFLLLSLQPYLCLILISVSLVPSCLGSRLFNFHLSTSIQLFFFISHSLLHNSHFCFNHILSISFSSISVLSSTLSLFISLVSICTFCIHHTLSKLFRYSLQSPNMRWQNHNSNKQVIIFCQGFWMHNGFLTHDMKYAIILYCIYSVGYIFCQFSRILFDCLSAMWSGSIA